MVMSNSAALRDTKTIPAGKFKATCLEVLDDVLEKDLKVIVTKRGKPVAHLVAPTEDEMPFVPLWGRSPNVKILGDITGQLDWPNSEEKWARLQNAKKK